MATKIDWCDDVWNPAWGCKNNCTYCYARKIAAIRHGLIVDAQKKYWEKKKRGGDIPDFDEMERELKSFSPVWLEGNFYKHFSGKNKRIFVNSMSDIAHWKPEWIERTIERVRETPQHTFMILTKKPEVAYHAKVINDMPKNLKLGISVDNYDSLTWDSHVTFLSIEPLREEMMKSVFDRAVVEKVDWVIVGPETGKHEGRISPKREWLENIARACRLKGTPVFMKSACKSIWREGLIQEYPEW